MPWFVDQLERSLQPNTVDTQNRKDVCSDASQFRANRGRATRRNRTTVMLEMARRVGL
jgi:hypothetical protein